MNRKQLIIGGIIFLALLILCIVLLVAFVRRQPPEEPAGIENRKLVSGLAYCSDAGVKPCVVSFGADAEGNMLVNILVPDLSYPAYYLKITRSAPNEESTYECFRVASSPNSTYCIGANMPPGEVLHLILISTKDNVVLAEGALSIIGLVFPTVAVVSPTPTKTPTEGAPATIAPTEATDFVLPTFTPASQFPTPTRTKPAYPGPTSYP